MIKERETPNLFSFQRAIGTIIASVWKILNLPHRHAFPCRQHSRILPLVLGEEKKKKSGKIWFITILKSLVSNGKSQAHLFLGAVVALLLMPSFFSFCMVITVKLKLARNFSYESLGTFIRDSFGKWILPYRVVEMKWAFKPHSFMLHF